MRYIVVELSTGHNKIFNLWNDMVNNKNSQIQNIGKIKKLPKLLEYERFLANGSHFKWSQIQINTCVNYTKKFTNVFL